MWTSHSRWLTARQTTASQWDSVTTGRRDSGTAKQWDNQCDRNNCNKLGNKFNDAATGGATCINNYIVYIYRRTLDMMICDMCSPRPVVKGQSQGIAR
jgi:hypothetical protein